MTPTHMGMSFGMRARGTAYTPDPWFSNGQLDVNHYFSVDGDDWLRPGDFASGNLTTGASATFSPVTTPTYRQAVTGAAGDPLGTAWTVNTTDGFTVGGSEFRYSTEAWAILFAFQLASIPSQLMALGNYNSATARGYMLRPRLVSGKLAYILYMRGNSAIVQPSVTTSVASTNTDPHYCFCYRRAGAAGCGIKTDGGDATPWTTDPGDMSNTARPFTLGASHNNAWGAVHGPTVWWSGAAAETVIAAADTTLPAWKAAW